MTVFKPNMIELTPQYITNFSKPQRFVRAMELKGLAPLILLETFVTSGRTIQANNRGGFDDARERLTEESIGALFWFAGVKVFNRINDFWLSKLLGIKNTNIDAHGDGVRKPLKNYLKWAKDAGQNLSKSKIAAFKATKIGLSILLANGLVGFVVPKLNQAITRAYHKDDKKFNPQVDFNKFRTMGHNPDFGMQQFMKNVSFTGAADVALNVAHKFENETIYQLLSTDVGISGGRTISARNNHERVEILWRDGSSIFFYMFCMPLVNKGLNMLQQGLPSRLNPVGARQATDYMKYVMGDKLFTPEEFETKMLGKQDVTSQMAKVKPGFKDGAIELDKFLEILRKEFTPEEYSKYADLAKRMSKLQPQIEGVSVLAQSQAEAIFKGGALNVPEFWDNVFTVAKGVEKETKVINGVRTQVITPNHKNPFKYVSQKDLDGTIEKIRNYTKGILKKASGANITPELLEKAYKNNMFKNSMNWGIGFAISAAFLSTIIPKIQYWITKKTTGSNTFPGTTDYSKKD